MLINTLRLLLGSWSSGKHLWLRSCSRSFFFLSLVIWRRKPHHDVSLCSPDWDSAANDLNKAAVCFKVKYEEIPSEPAFLDPHDHLPTWPTWPTCSGGLQLGGVQSCSSEGLRGICQLWQVCYWTLSWLRLYKLLELLSNRLCHQLSIIANVCLCSLYHAAKQLEGALLVCREQGRLEEVV